MFPVGIREGSEPRRGQVVWRGCGEGGVVVVRVSGGGGSVVEREPRTGMG